MKQALITISVIVAIIICLNVLLKCLEVIANLGVIGPVIVLLIGLIILTISIFSVTHLIKQ